MWILMYLQCMRPLQWVKNLLVFAAPFAAGAFSELGELTPLVYLFLMFCAAASTNYVLNDWLDRDYDSQHSLKKLRPIASGKIGYETLLLLLGFLFCLQILLSFLIPTQAIIWVVIYITISISYSLYFKRIAVVEMFLVAIGFMVRAFAGAAAFKVEASSWFLIVIGFGALFLVANKRLAELTNQKSSLTREVMENYSNPFLILVIGSSMTACLVGYTLWAFQYSNGTQYIKFSVIVFAVALMRYHWITGWRDAEKPEVVLFTDGVLVGLGLIFLVLISVAIYG